VRLFALFCFPLKEFPGLLMMPRSQVSSTWLHLHSSLFVHPTLSSENSALFPLFSSVQFGWKRSSLFFLETYLWSSISPLSPLSPPEGTRPLRPAFCFLCALVLVLKRTPPPVSSSQRWHLLSPQFSSTFLFPLKHAYLSSS